MNNYRDEVEIEIGGKARKALLTPTAIAEIENATGKGIYRLGIEIETMQMRFQDLTILWRECLVAGEGKKNAPSTEEIGNAIQQMGIQKIIPLTAQFLSDGLSGDPEDKEAEPGEATAAENTATDSPSAA